jgi:hypothetical protein
MNEVHLKITERIGDDEPTFEEQQAQAERELLEAKREALKQESLQQFRQNHPEIVWNEAVERTIVTYMGDSDCSVENLEIAYKHPALVKQLQGSMQTANQEKHRLAAAILAHFKEQLSPESYKNKSEVFRQQLAYLTNEQLREALVTLDREAEYRKKTKVELRQIIRGAKRQRPTDLPAKFTPFDLKMMFDTREGREQAHRLIQKYGLDAFNRRLNDKEQD